MSYFYYDFTHRSWQDHIRSSSIKYGTAGDLIFVEDRYIINLWSKVSRQELYDKEIFFGENNNDIKIIGKVFGKKTLDMIYRMARQYLTSYRSIIWLWIWDLGKYIKQLDKNKISKNKKDPINFINNKYSPITHPDKTIWQTLILMPDVLTISSIIKDRDYVLIWQDGHSKVMKYYIQVQKWQKNLLITTHWNIWMDWKNLTNIVIFYPQTRYYKNQLDPRYDTIEVCHKLAEIRDADIKIIWW